MPQKSILKCLLKKIIPTKEGQKILKGLDKIKGQIKKVNLYLKRNMKIFI